MQGRRRYPPDPTEDFPNPIPDDCQPGDYWIDQATQVWYCQCPNGLFGSLEKHQVTEHEDRTITVSPSILVKIADSRSEGIHERSRSWHGYLEQGVWREV